MMNFKDINDITVEQANEMAKNGLYLVIKDGKCKGFATK